jgi:hypothetical protein
MMLLLRKNSLIADATSLMTNNLVSTNQITIALTIAKEESSMSLLRTV